LRAISSWQPWASLIVAGVKLYETRHWEVRWRGPIAIHAPKHWDLEQREITAEFWTEWRVALRAARMPLTPPRGVIVGTAELTDCQVIGEAEDERGSYVTLNDRRADLVSARELDFGNWSPGRFAWRLQRPVMFKTPIPFRGAQGFFDVPDQLIRAALQ
jgi:hypothetical protein